MKNINLIALTFSLLLFSCTQTEKSSGENKTVKSTEAVVKFKDQHIENTYRQYLKVKNALIESDAAKAKEAGAALAKELKAIKGCENTSKLAGEISGSTDLKVQRKKFIVLSSDLIALIKHADIKTGSAFVQFCPMANNGNGGYWLASESEIRNPYYGDEMLNCGEVKEELKQTK